MAKNRGGVGLAAFWLFLYDEIFNGFYSFILYLVDLLDFLFVERHTKCIFFQSTLGTEEYSTK